MMKMKINKMETVPRVQNKVRQRGKKMKISRANKKVQKSNKKIQYIKNEKPMKHIEYLGNFQMIIDTLN